MDRADAWGVGFDTSTPGQLTVTVGTWSVTIPYDSARDAITRANGLWRVLQRRLQQRAAGDESWPPRWRYAYLYYKVLAYDERLQAIDAEIATYQRPRDVPPALTAERDALQAKRDRLFTLRNEARQVV